jgi:ethanolamine utilization protein EutA
VIVDGAWGDWPDPLRALDADWRADRRWFHDDIFSHFHLGEASPASQAIADYIAGQEIVQLQTVGIDIGSSTSHLLFATITLQRETEKLSSRYVVVKREVVWRSPIRFTPFLPNGLIDADALGVFIRESYAAAGIERDEIDSGAVILTGEAIKRRNARAIDELFAGEAGKFVCATAGHQLEATLAAHGSGAVRLSRERDTALLHVDIGGGTTKLAMIDRGRILSVAAIAVGGRLVAADDGGTWSRFDESAEMTAEDLGLGEKPDIADESVRHAIAKRLAKVAVDKISGTELDALGSALMLTDELDRRVAPSAITFSGGVSEYLFGREENELGDIAKLLAGELRHELANRLTIPVIDPGNGIRATVIGASQFTVQVSGKTIYLSDDSVLPLRNVPVVHLAIPSRLVGGELNALIERSVARADLQPEARLALAFEWTRDPDYHDLLAVSKAIVGVMDSAKNGAPKEPLVVLVDGDVGKTVGHLLRDELGLRRSLISIDGVQLQELDFVDVGEMLFPAGVIPLVIKSLVFS